MPRGVSWGVASFTVWSCKTSGAGTGSGRGSGNEKRRPKHGRQEEKQNPRKNPGAFFIFVFSQKYRFIIIVKKFYFQHSFAHFPPRLGLF